MTHIAKVIEVSAASRISVEEAVQSGLNKIAESVDGIQGAWISEIEVRTSPAGQIEQWRVKMRVTFLVE